MMRPNGCHHQAARCIYCERPYDGGYLGRPGHQRTVLIVHTAVRIYIIDRAHAETKLTDYSSPITSLPLGPGCGTCLHLPKVSEAEPTLPTSGYTFSCSPIASFENDGLCSLDLVRIAVFLREAPST
jgi:hypothetical protein